MRMLEMPMLGQGTWRMGESRGAWETEVRALRAGIDAGMPLIDTAEMYASGGAEKVVGEAIQGIPRDSLYIVSKVYPYNAGGARLAESCEASLSRLGVETLDLYLLHWPGSIPLEETVSGMEGLVAAGKICRWGVSNFDTGEMQALFGVPGGDRCAANQVLYHLGSRGIEFDLLPWLQARNVPVMAYCPLAQAGSLRRGLLGNAAVLAVAEKYGITPMQVLLGFVLAQPGMCAIPKAGDPEHVRQNAAVAARPLDEDDLQRLNAAFPPPMKKVPLDIE